MTDFIKFGKGIANYLTNKFGGFAGVEYKISHEELAMQNEDVLKVLEELGIDKHKHTVIEVVSKAKSNYEIASIRLKNKANTFLKGAFSVSEEKTGPVEKYHFTTKDTIYNGHKTIEGEYPKTTQNEPVIYTKEEIIELYKSGMSIEEISSRIWTSHPTVRKMIPNELNELTRKGKEIRAQKIIEMYKSGMRTQDIADQLGIYQSTVTRNIPKELKEQRKRDIAEGLHNNILKLHEQGLDVKEISSELGINEPTVYVHLKRQRIADGLQETPINYEIEVTKLRKQGMNVKEIAKELGISETTVYKYIPKEDKPGMKVTEEIKEKIISMRKDGKSTKEIAKELGISESSVNDNLPKEMKIQYQSIREDLTEKIIELRKEGYQLEDIAQKTGMSRGSVKKRLPKELVQKIVVPKATRIKIEDMYAKGLSPEEIAEKLKIKLIEVKTSIRYPLKKETELPEETKILIFEKRKSGISVEEISKELGIKFLDINKNLPPEFRQKRLITDEVVAQIIEMRKAGKSNIEIAEEIGISRESVINHTPEEYRMSTKKLTPEQRNKILEMRKQGFTSQEIADKLKINIGTVNKNLPDELKIGTKVEKELINKIIEMRKAGISVKDICEQTGLSTNTIYTYLPEELKQGNTPRINDAVYKKIIKMRISGMSTDSISKALGINTSTIQRTYPDELKNIRTDIDAISEEEFKNAVLKGKTRFGVCEQLHIKGSALNRLIEKFGVISKAAIKDTFKETQYKKYEQFSNDDLKERFFNVINSLFKNKKVNTHSELGKILDNIADEILTNDINFETREKLIKLIRSLDLMERNIISEKGLSKSQELMQLKAWANKSAKIDNIKDGLNYIINNLLPKNEEFELAEILSKYKIKGIDDPNVEILDKYIQALINADNPSKICAEILREETYKNAPPQIKILAQKYSIYTVGEINSQVAGRYIRNMMAFDNPSVKVAYPEKFLKIVKDEKLPKNLSVKYLSELDKWFEEADLDKATLKEFCKKFDINDSLGGKIIKEYVTNTYCKHDTKIMAQYSNIFEEKPKPGILQEEVIFAPEAKVGIIDQFGFPDGIKWLIDFENAMHIFVPPEGNYTGIKYMKNRGEYEVKLSNESNRLLSSDKSLRFDIYKKEGIHTKKKGRK